MYNHEKYKFCLEQRWYLRSSSLDWIDWELHKNSLAMKDLGCLQKKKRQEKFVGTNPVTFCSNVSFISALTDVTYMCVQGHTRGTHRGTHRKGICVGHLELQTASGCVKGPISNIVMILHPNSWKQKSWSASSEQLFPPPEKVLIHLKDDTVNCARPGTDGETSWQYWRSVETSK